MTINGDPLTDENTKENVGASLKELKFLSECHHKTLKICRLMEIACLSPCLVIGLNSAIERIGTWAVARLSVDSSEYLRKAERS
jgi:GTP cyclohydrolase I